jgi:hypothetical protein
MESFRLQGTLRFMTDLLSEADLTYSSRSLLIGWIQKDY